MKLKVNAPLDPGFMPMAVVYREFEAAVKAEGRVSSGEGESIIHKTQRGCLPRCSRSLQGR